MWWVQTTRETEEQLEAALSLLDAARAKQEALRADNEALSARITSQANTLLRQEDVRNSKSVHLVEERQPMSKRVLFALAIILPLATHAATEAVRIEVTIVSKVRLVQAVVLFTATLVLLVWRRRRWRRIRADRVLFVRPDGAAEQPGSPRAAGNEIAVHEPAASSSSISSASMASEEELALLAEVKANLHRDRHMLSPLLPKDNEPLLDVQLIRFLREHGPNAPKIEACYRRALEWRQASLPPIPQAADGGWLGSADMPHGAWATKFAPIGLYCGRSKVGCPVKIERLGEYDLKGLQESGPDYRVKFNEFYLGLIEFLERRLDEASVEEGRLVQTYEIFDLKGLGTHMLTMTVLNFTRDILLNFATHYPSSFRKAAIINAPSFLPRFWRLVAMVLPRSVKAKVVILGTDYHEVLSQDLGEEALAWVEASNFDLGRAPFRRRHSSSSLEDEEPLDGEAVLVEESD